MSNYAEGLFSSDGKYCTFWQHDTLVAIVELATLHCDECDSTTCYHANKARRMLAERDMVRA